MQLQRIELFDIENLVCNEPNREYHKALAGREVAPSSRKSMAVRWLTCGVSLLIFFGLIGTPNRGTVLLTVSIAIFLMFLYEGIARRYPKRFDKFEKTIVVRTPEQEDVANSVYHERCSRVARAGWAITRAIKHWNAYVDRVELGTVTRFAFDEELYLDIMIRLQHVTRMDRLVYRLLCDKMKIEQRQDTQTNVDRLAVVRGALDSLSFSMIDDIPRWVVKEVPEKYPALVRF